ncbi:MAG: hypothetical protein QMC59_02900 [Candidatus Poseidoniaceae archaeon]
MNNDEQPPASLVPMDVHKTLWSQQDLLQTILSRHFTVHGSLGGTVLPAWNVSTKGEDDAHEQLSNLNQHLVKLGWMGKLLLDQPWVVQILPIPERQFPMRGFYWSLWALSALTLTLAGAYWLEGATPAGGWFVESAFLDAVIGYTLPVLSALFIASHLQRYIAARFGLRVGHIVPVPEPSIALWSLGAFPKSMLIWPFGLFLIPSLPRMDARLWPDRKALGWSALSVPATLVSLGMLFWTVGLWLTPDFIAVATQQNVAYPPLAVELLSELTLDAGYEQRLVWAHPFVHVGALLTFFGCLSMLPIPTFPGGRLMVARSGHGEARSSSNQIFIFMILLAFAWMFGAFSSGLNIWTFVLSMAIPLLLFMGSDRRTPIILDEPKGLELSSMKNMGLVALAIILFALPQQVPFAVDEDWDDEIVYSIDGFSQATLENETWSAELSMTAKNPSSLKRTWAVLEDRYDADLNAWTLSWDCDGEDSNSIGEGGCGSILPPNTQSTVTLSMVWNGVGDAPITTTFGILTSSLGLLSVEEVSVQPDTEVFVATPWSFVDEEGELKRCLELGGLGTELVNVSLPNAEEAFDLEARLHWIEDHAGLSATYDERPDRICLRGLDPIVLRASTLDVIHINGLMFNAGTPELPLKAVVPSTGWQITNQPTTGWGFELGAGTILSATGEACPFNASLATPLPPAAGDWVWDLEVRDISSIPAVTNGTQNLTVLMPDEATVLVCSEPLSSLPRLNFSVEEGPEVILIRTEVVHRMWSNVWMAATNGTLLHADGGSFNFYNPGNSTVPVQLNFEGNGAQWAAISSSANLEPGENQFEFEPSNSTLSTLWFEHVEGRVVIHLGSYI